MQRGRNFYPSAYPANPYYPLTNNIMRARFGNIDPYFGYQGYKIHNLKRKHNTSNLLKPQTIKKDLVHSIFFNRNKKVKIRPNHLSKRNNNRHGGFLDILTKIGSKILPILTSKIAKDVGTKIATKGAEKLTDKAIDWVFKEPAKKKIKR